MEAAEDSDGNAAGTMLPGLEEAKGGQIRRKADHRPKGWEGTASDTGRQTDKHRTTSVNHAEKRPQRPLSLRSLLCKMGWAEATVLAQRKVPSSPLWPALQ